MQVIAATVTKPAISPRRFGLGAAAVDDGRSRLRPNHGTIVIKFALGDNMIEPLLCGIVLGLIPVTLLGLFVAAWNQYRRALRG